MIRKPEISGSEAVLCKLTEAWRAMHQAYLLICEINEGTSPCGQDPVEFSVETSSALRASLGDLRQMQSKLCYAASGKQSGPNALAERQEMCASCKGCAVR